jgi:hypothetical protein
MWPLFCNEIGLSYDQEERARNFQRAMLQESTTWLDRHTARASGLAMQSYHDSLNSVAFQQRQRERSTMKGLSAGQRLKFMVWAQANADRIRAKFEKKRQEPGKPKATDKFELSKSHHVAANLYILNHRLQKVLSSSPQQLTIVTPAALQRLSRRPSFEPLGQLREEGGHALSRDESFESSGSLKRSSSSLSMDDEDKPPPQQVSPEDGQEAAKSTVEKELGFIKDIIPPPAAPVPPPAPAAPIALPFAAASQQAYLYAPTTPVPLVTTSHPQNHASHVAMHHPTPIAAHPYPGAHSVQHHPISHQAMGEYPPHPYQHQHHQPYQHHQSHQQPYAHPPQSHHVEHHHEQQHQQAQPPAQQSLQQPSAHVRKSSFLPTHLNVVTEEMFPSGEGAEDFFMSLMDDEDDWAIGGGVDMDTAT